MRPSWPAQRHRRAPCAGHQRFALTVEAVAHPMLEVVAARALLIILDELRAEAIVVAHVRVELAGCRAETWTRLET